MHNAASLEGIPLLIQCMRLIWKTPVAASKWLSFDPLTLRLANSRNCAILRRANSFRPRERLWEGCKRRASAKGLCCFFAVVDFRLEAHLRFYRIGYQAIPFRFLEDAGGTFFVAFIAYNEGWPHVDARRRGSRNCRIMKPMAMIRTTIQSGTFESLLPPIPPLIA